MVIDALVTQERPVWWNKNTNIYRKAVHPSIENVINKDPWHHVDIVVRGAAKVIFSSWMIKKIIA